MKDLYLKETGLCAQDLLTIKFNSQCIWEGRREGSTWPSSYGSILMDLKFKINSLACQDGT